MSAFYGKVAGCGKTVASRRGHQDIKVSAQSWNGSVITRLYYSEDKLMVDIQIAEGSSANGYTVFCGTLDDLKAKLERR